MAVGKNKGISKGKKGGKKKCEQFLPSLCCRQFFKFGFLLQNLSKLLSSCERPRCVCGSRKASSLAGDPSEWVSTFGISVFCSIDPFSKKDWYDIKAPSTFNQRSLGKTLVTRTQGTTVRTRKNNRYVLLSVLYSALLLGEHLYGRLVRDVGDVYTS